MAPMYEISLDADRPRLDGRNLEALISLYLADVYRRSDPKTGVGYRRKLAYFVDWWREREVKILDGDSLADFARHLEGLRKSNGAPLSFNTRRDALRRLGQCLRWAHQTGRIPVDLSGEIPRPRGHQPPRSPVELSLVASMIAIAGLGQAPERDRAIVAVLAGTGIRCNEAAGLRVEHLTAHADGAGYIQIVQAKNDKPRVVAFDAYTGVYLIRQADVVGEVTGPLFPSRKRGAGLSASGIRKLIARLSAEAGQAIGPHDLRRLYATVWSRTLRGEAYGQLLQHQLGHEDWSTTAQYSLQDVGDTLETIRRHAVTPLAVLAHRGENEAER